MTTQSKSSSRCKICNKKLRLDFYLCACDENAKFCDQHKFAFAHACSLNKFELHKTELGNKLVKCDKQKMIRME